MIELREYEGRRYSMGSAIVWRVVGYDEQRKIYTLTIDGYPNFRESVTAKQFESDFIDITDGKEKLWEWERKQMEDDIKRDQRRKELLRHGLIEISEGVCLDTYLLDKYPNNGLMGVPITFLDKYNSEQFEIVGIDREIAGDRFYIDEERKYARILIRRK